jgi:hypothetical protein
VGGGLFRLGRERQALGHPELAEQLADVRTLDGDAVPLPHALVEHVQAHRYAGPMLAVGVGQPNRRADSDLLQRRRPGLSHPSGVREPVGHDGDDAPVRPHTPDRGLQVADSSERVPSPAEGPREGRVHDDEAGTGQRGHGGRDHGAVVARDLCVGESGFQPGTARRVDLIELQRRDCRQLRHEEAVTRARLEDNVLWRWRREVEGDRSEVERGRELLPLDLLLAPNGLGREPVEDRRGRLDVCHYNVRSQCTAFPHYKCNGMLQYLEALALGPAPFGVGPSVCANHGVVQHRPGDLHVREDRGFQGLGSCGAGARAEERVVEQVGHGGSPDWWLPFAAHHSSPPPLYAPGLTSAQSPYRRGGGMRRRSSPRGR